MEKNEKKTGKTKKVLYWTLGGLAVIGAAFGIYKMVKKPGEVAEGVASIAESAAETVAETVTEQN